MCGGDSCQLCVCVWFFGQTVHCSQGTKGVNSLVADGLVGAVPSGFFPHAVQADRHRSPSQDCKQGVHFCACKNTASCELQNHLGDLYDLILCCLFFWRHVYLDSRPVATSRKEKAIMTGSCDVYNVSPPRRYAYVSATN